MVESGVIGVGVGIAAGVVGLMVGRVGRVERVVSDGDDDVRLIGAWRLEKRR